MGARDKQKVLRYIINHTILPPRLPQEAEDPRISHDAEKALLRQVESQVESYIREIADGQSLDVHKLWHTVQLMVLRCLTLASTHNLSADKLIDMFSAMGDLDVLLVRVKSQNAMLILRRNGDRVIFECFEAAPKAGSVMASQGSLVRTFPAYAVAISIETFDDSRFQAQLAAMLSKADSEIIDEMMPQSHKAGSKMPEIRDTANPGIISDMLMALLSALGEPVEVIQILKRTRDDVLWDSALLPWRRSPLWLGVRVAIQTTLITALAKDVATIQYKNFMIYLLCEIASTALTHSLQDDLCHITVAKVARRVHKLGDRTLGFVQQRALEICESTRKIHSRKWRKVQQSDKIRASSIPSLDWRSDTALSLENSKPYLDLALAHGHDRAAPTVSFRPECRTWLATHRGLPILRDIQATEERVFMLGGFENWIADSLPSWLARFDTNFPSSDDCTAVADIAQSYWSKARIAYANAPQQYSHMILILIELWHALDRMVTKVIPLLEEYSPVLSSSFFYPLLLPKKDQMLRLHCVELYLRSRQNQAKRRTTSVFSDSGHQEFAVAYYATSEAHKALRDRIEAEAVLRKSEKEAEWESATREYQKLKAEAQALECEYTTDRYGSMIHYASACRKCGLERSAHNMSIKKYEWPLPADECSCIAAIFELDCPTGFAAWRNLTWMLLHDVGRSTVVKGNNPADRLSEYTGLRNYFVENGSRLTLASKVKSMLKTHYCCTFPVRREDCFSNNALRYTLLDAVQTAWVKEQTDLPSVQKQCTLQLSKGSYSCLQFAVDSTDHTQNKVISDQESCPTTISLHEYISFGSLRADGERTQWLNIKRELAASNLSFNTEDVSSLILQAAWQAGSEGQCAYRMSHLQPKGDVFSVELLAIVTRNLDATETNWKCYYAMQVLICLVLRVLSLTLNMDVVESAFGLLSRMREATLKWTEALEKLLTAAKDDDKIQNLQNHLLMAAFLCKLTYDVDTGYRARVMSDDRDLSTWVVGCVLVRQNTPGSCDLLPSSLCRAYLHDLRLTHSFEDLVLSRVTSHTNSGLDQAVTHVWSGFQPKTAYWKTWPDPNKRWVSIDTRPTPGRKSQTVHYNILEGELLVNGGPLGRLPREYTQSKIYQRMFGAQILSVFSADMPGMIYMSAQRIYGWTVYFTTRYGEVVIKIRQAESTLELVPHTSFNDDLPSAFINDYAHWLDPATREIEMRLLDQRWTFDPGNWRLHYRLNGPSELCRSDRSLIDVRSATCSAIMAIFGGLESRYNTHVFCTGNETLWVTLPRFDLNFFLNEEGYFQCAELGKIVDPDQSLGTMIGLQSRLILSGLAGLAKKHDRILVIPLGSVSIAENGHHVNATISTSGNKIRLFRYQIDSILGRLQGTGDMVSNLYKAYLHAVTSHFLPDPFTGYTGTEEALACLRQRSMSLFKPADDDVVSLLNLIATLTPLRTYYPTHLKVMQQVKWHPQLSMLVQHEDYIALAQQILDSGDRYLFFYPGSKANVSMYKGTNMGLISRARIRNAVYRNPECGASGTERSHDITYQCRAQMSCPERAAKTYQLASIVRDPPAKFSVSTSLIDELNAMEIIAGFTGPYNTAAPLSDLLNLAFPSSWAKLIELCRQSYLQKHKFKLLFAFSVIAYGSRIGSVTQLTTLVAFAFEKELRAVDPPYSHPSFSLGEGSDMKQKRISTIIQKQMEPYKPSRRMDASTRREEQDAHDKLKSEESQYVLRHYASQWPCSNPQPPPARKASLLNVSETNNRIKAQFAHWTRNAEFKAYIGRIQTLLNRIDEDLPLKPYKATYSKFSSSFEGRGAPVLPALADVMSTEPPRLSPEKPMLPPSGSYRDSGSNVRLKHLVTTLGSDKGDTKARCVRKQYSEDLLGSLQAYSKYKERVIPSRLTVSLEEIKLHHVACERRMFEIFEKISASIHREGRISQIVEAGGLWPRLTVRTLLVRLSSNANYTSPPRWKSCLIALGEATTMVQRARRLLLAGELMDISAFSAELENVGRTGWAADHWPEWLLVEIENDLLIRPNQAQVALEMLSPSSSSNSLTQLNMGEGKSSVIVPLVAVAIANNARLSRVIVLKSLAKQMGNTLAVRLGGLLDRPIYYMPFTRKIAMTDAVVSRIQSLLKLCKESGGILLAQPEHILSFKLIGIERLVSGDIGLASSLLKAQRWLEHNARDLLDESDEILDVKFQLIYTLGTQRMMDGQPDRWLLTQGLFDIIEKHAMDLHKANPEQLEVKYRTTASFPTIRLLCGEVSKKLLSRVADDVVEGYLAALSFEKCPLHVKQAVLQFIHNKEVTQKNCELIRGFFDGRESFIQKLLLVRGLIAGKILLFVLRGKRWSVNYGVHPTRCLSAVPYRAKGVPAPSAEFGHPDVAIALTCLTYYYTGLTNAQIRQCFEMLQKVDDPSLEYGTWIARLTSLPSHLRDWNSVNLEDNKQCLEELFPAVQYSKKLADYFLASVVFPKEGKEFDEKLSTSGWDIPSTGGAKHLTTGFSGTNDNRFLLPLSIVQRDLPNLHHTSGKVLDYVLREENLRYVCAKDDHSQQVASRELLCFIYSTDPSVRVLIDVGAQILDVQNLELVKMWMEVVCDVEAAVFFDKDDNVMVVSRDQKIESLSASSFQSRMDRCLVYLDEVHTRGTDLKLPNNARAAVTLGPRLSKDKLVQACMRLRKLAHGQSLMFVAPPEVHQNIIDTTGRPSAEINGYDVIAWSLEQSCASIERAQPLRVSQGLSHHQRQVTMTAFLENHRNLDDLKGTIDVSHPTITAFREKEEQRLVDLYAPPHLKVNVNPGLVERYREDPDPDVQQLITTWKNVDFSIAEGASMQEEHEREVAHEVEAETQVQRPPHVAPCQPTVDNALRLFISTGDFSVFKYSQTAIKVINATSAKRQVPAAGLLSHLRVTQDFASTTRHNKSDFQDNYLRPVNWILTSKREKPPSRVCIISQYEVNQLYDSIHSESSMVKLHSYEPRVTKSMSSVDFPSSNPLPSTTEWQSLDPELRQELNLFGGQLYFNTFADYRRFCAILDDKTPVDAEKTLSWIKAWTAIRRKGQNFLPTHVGQMVSNRTIKEEAFE